jgi:hypothetical protein
MDIVDKYEISYGWSEAEKQESDRLYKEQIKNMKLAEMSLFTIDDLRKMTMLSSSQNNIGGCGYSQVVDKTSITVSGTGGGSGYIPNVNNARVNIEPRGSLVDTLPGGDLINFGEVKYFTMVKSGLGLTVKLPDIQEEKPTKIDYLAAVRDIVGGV